MRGTLRRPRGRQIAGRFTLVPTARLPYNSEWQGLVATLEVSLHLHDHEPGSITDLDGYLHNRTGGMIGSLSHLIRGTALDAILTGSEKITEKSLTAIALDHSSDSD